MQEGGIRRDGVFAPLNRLTLLDEVVGNNFGDAKVESVAADITDRAALERFLGPQDG